MSFRDQWAKDSEGNEFLFTVEMQRKLSRAGLPLDPAYLAGLEGGGTAQPASGRAVASAAPPAPPPAEQKLEPETIQIDPATGKYLGRLKWYNPVKGYGFIARGGGEDIFFHKTAVAGDPANLAEGDWVLYDVEERRKGLEATEVEVYDGEPA